MIRFLKASFITLTTAFWVVFCFGVLSCAVENHRTGKVTDSQVQEYNRGIEEMNRIIERERQIVRAAK